MENRYTRWPSGIYGIALALIGLSGCFSEAPDTTGPGNGGEVAATVEMTPQLVFEPRNVTVRVGESIRWRNTSNFVHTSTADPLIAMNATSVDLPPGASTFNSGNVQPGGQFVQAFTVAGQYTYFCIPHEGSGMIGTITVTP